MENRRWERPRTRTTGVCPRPAQVRAVGDVIEKPASSSKQSQARAPPRSLTTSSCMVRGTLSHACGGDVEVDCSGRAVGVRGAADPAVEYAIARRRDVALRSDGYGSAALDRPTRNNHEEL